MQKGGQEIIKERHERLNFVCKQHVIDKHHNKQIHIFWPSYNTNRQILEFYLYLWIWKLFHKRKSPPTTFLKLIIPCSSSFKQTALRFHQRRNKQSFERRLVGDVCARVCTLRFLPQRKFAEKSHHKISLREQHTGSVLRWLSDHHLAALGQETFLNVTEVGN